MPFLIANRADVHNGLDGLAAGASRSGLVALTASLAVASVPTAIAVPIAVVSPAVPPAVSNPAAARVAATAAAGRGPAGAARADARARTVAAADDLIQIIAGSAVDVPGGVAEREQHRRERGGNNGNDQTILDQALSGLGQSQAAKPLSH